MRIDKNYIEKKKRKEIAMRSKKPSYSTYRAKCVHAKLLNFEAAGIGHNEMKSVYVVLV